MTTEPHGVLNADIILKLMRERELIITPILNLEQISGSGVDVRLGTSIIFPKKTYIGSIDITKETIINEKCRYFEKMRLKYHTPFTLHPNQLILGATFEYLSLPKYLHAQILSRSSYGRLGLIVATAVTIHPGYKGVLTLELCNLSDSPITLYPGMPVAQLVFYELSGGSVETNGSYLYSTEAELPGFLYEGSKDRWELRFWGEKEAKDKQENINP